MTETQIAERMARVETELKYLQREVTELKGDIEKIKEKQDQILEILTQAKGVRNLARFAIWLVSSGILAGIFTYWPAIKAMILQGA